LSDQFPVPDTQYLVAPNEYCSDRKIATKPRSSLLFISSDLMMISYLSMANIPQ